MSQTGAEPATVTQIHNTMKRQLRLRAAQNFHPLTGEVRIIAWWDCEACDNWLLDCSCEVD